MKTPAYLALLVPVLGLILLSCSDLSNPVSEPLSTPEGESPGDVLAKTDIAQFVTSILGFQVTFDGPDYDPVADHTTFTYTVEETEGGPDNFHFSIDLPECAGNLQAYAPTEGVSLNSDPNTGFINGIDWHPSTSSTGPFEFSITFPGDVPLGAVDLAIKSSETREVKLWYGPCGGLFDITGTVFEDYNGNTELDPTESGINDVTVTVQLSNGETTTTDASGTYLFEGVFPILDGDPYPYTVSIPEAINGDLFWNYAPTTAVTFPVNPDDNVKNFGFVERFDISGYVFADADKSGTFEDPNDPIEPGNESGITNVTVQLDHVCRDNVDTVQTDASGYYVFEGCVPIFDTEWNEKEYTINIPPESIIAGDFNVELFDSFEPTTDTELPANRDVNVKNFGFDANTENLKGKFEGFADPTVGQLTSTAEDLKYWTGAVRAFKNGTKKADPNMQSYLNAVKDLALTGDNDPFLGNIPKDDPQLAQAALDILTEQPKNPLDLLKKELLTTELNFVSGRVICVLDADLICQPLTDQTLLETLIAWGETVVVNDPDYQPASGKSGGALGVAGTSDARDVFKAYNSSGGGTGGNE